MAEWSPDAPAIDGPESMCWAAAGWECAAEESVQPADGRTRAQAARRFAGEVAEAFTDVRVVKRYVRALTIAECWSECIDHPAQPMPPGWTPHEDCPTWEFVPRNHPEGVPVWVCRMAGEPVPSVPQRVPRGYALST